MIVIYNIIQLFALVILSPLICFVVLLNKKYRIRIFRRLGSGFRGLLCNLPTGQRRIWLHALSVGEVASVRTLVKKLRRELPEAVIFFSCTTASGEEYARKSLGDEVDFIFVFPLDLIWLVRRYIRSISPDLFILTETDFWPNFLYSLKDYKVPALLVNGRVSAASHKYYQIMRPVILPMLLAFDYLGVQRKLDRENMISIGVPAQRVIQPGNLKYDGIMADALLDEGSISRAVFAVPENSLLLVAGSTHPGEEEAIFDLAAQEPAGGMADLRLIIAPRNIERCRELLEMAERYGLNCRLKSDSSAPETRVLILDTLGELAKVYSLADLAFVGGSLVPEGGHNPLEPAALGKPVLFGPYMEEFQDISTEMTENGCAVQVDSAADLISQARILLNDPSLRDDLGRRARNFVTERQGATDRYYQVIESLLNPG